jgi:hypothetical protein
MDSTTVTITAPLKSLEVSLVLVAWQSGRKYTGVNYLTLRQSLMLKKDKRSPMIPVESLHLTICNKVLSLRYRTKLFH